MKSISTAEIFEIVRDLLSGIEAHEQGDWIDQETEASQPSQLRYMSYKSGDWCAMDRGRGEAWLRFRYLTDPGFNGRIEG